MLSRMSLDHTPFCLKNQGNDPIEIRIPSQLLDRQGVPIRDKDDFIPQSAHLVRWRGIVWKLSSCHTPPSMASAPAFATGRATLPASLGKLPRPPWRTSSAIKPSRLSSGPPCAPDTFGDIGQMIWHTIQNKVPKVEVSVPLDAARCDLLSGWNPSDTQMESLGLEPSNAPDQQDSTTDLGCRPSKTSDFPKYGVNSIAGPRTAGVALGKIHAKSDLFGILYFPASKRRT
jgi:hypothetical protein